MSADTQVILDETEVTYINLSGVSGLCSCCLPVMPTMISNAELWCREGKPSKGSGPGTFCSSFSLSAIRERESRSSGFPTCPRAADPALPWVFAKAGYFSSSPKTDSRFVRWTPHLVNGCLQGLQIKAFQSLWFSVISMGKIVLHPIQLGLLLWDRPLKQIVLLLRPTTFLVQLTHLLQSSGLHKGLSPCYLEFCEIQSQNTCMEQLRWRKSMFSTNKRVSLKNKKLPQVCKIRLARKAECFPLHAGLKTKKIGRNTV